MRFLFVTISLLMLSAMPVWSEITPELTRRLERLDHYLENKKQYDTKHDRRIDQCREQLKNTRDDRRRYDLCIELYDLYKSYKADSAYAYANRSLALSKRLGSADYKLESECAMAFCLLSAGLYKEAFDMLAMIDCDGVSRKHMKTYYSLVVRLNYAIADYNRAMPYHDDYVARGNLFTDSLLMLTEPQSVEWWFATGQRQMKQYDYRHSRETFVKLLDADSTIDTHLKAIVTSSVGWMHWCDGNEEAAMEYLIEAAVCDVMSSTKETTALRGLAELLYKHGDIQRATDYVQSSLDDANFYNARQRKIEVGEIMPIIERDRYEILRNHTTTLIVAVVVISLLVVVILVISFYLYRQKKTLLHARNIISRSNAALQEANRKLMEADNIKNEYIGNSFYINSEFIDKMEKLYRMVDRKIQARQYEDLRQSLKESVLDKERDNMFVVFDATFLKIFPDFVERYNRLFPEAEQRVPDKKNTLTTEMRIFALIRLGITESERIARFLKYSVHTINTYKTRVKNKSLLENELFEKSIMEIGGIK